MPKQRGYVIRGAALVLAGLIFSAGALAQADPLAPQTVSLAECLQPSPATRGQPTYPPEALRSKASGVVDVDLVFTAPDAPPTVVLLPRNTPVATVLVQSVRDHVAKYRLPCLAPGGDPVRLRQVFEFVTVAERALVQAGRPRPTDPPRPNAACLVRIEPGSQPDYPMASLRRERQGVLYLQARFTTPDQPPEVRVLSSTVDTSMRLAAERFVKGYRTPCLTAGEQYKFNMLFRYSIEGNKVVTLADVALTTWLGASRATPSPVYFDLDSMGCPFDVALEYWRPHGPNTVAEIGPSRPERRLFLDWLADSTLNVDEARNTDLLGHTTTIKVPCGRIALDAEPTPTASPSPKPQE